MAFYTRLALRDSHKYENSKNISLLDIVKLFDSAINEEQAWGVCYQCCQSFKNGINLSQSKDFTNHGIDAIRFCSDGSVRIGLQETLDNITLPEDNHTSPDESDGLDENMEERCLSSLGLAMFQALDYGLVGGEERHLSPDLEMLIDTMTDSERASDDGNDEGIEEDHDDTLVAECTCHSVIQVCQEHLRHVQDVGDHYQAVCRALVAEVTELLTFLDNISDSEKEGTASGDATDSLVEHYRASWARLWVQVMRDLRRSVKLKKVERLHVYMPPLEYELTPYEMLMDDIRTRRYTLNKIMVDGQLPERPQSDGHEVILAFIRSRPPLNSAKLRVLKTRPTIEKSPIEKLLDDIRSGPTLKCVTPGRPRVFETSRTSMFSFDNVSSDEDKPDSATPVRRVIKADFDFSKLLESSYEEDSDDDLDDIASDIGSSPPTPRSQSTTNLFTRHSFSRTDHDTSGTNNHALDNHSNILPSNKHDSSNGSSPMNDHKRDTLNKFGLSLSPSDNSSTSGSRSSDSSSTSPFAIPKSRNQDTHNNPHLTNRNGQSPSPCGTPNNQQSDSFRNIPHMKKNIGQSASPCGTPDTPNQRLSISEFGDWFIVENTKHDQGASTLPGDNSQKSGKSNGTRTVPCGTPHGKEISAKCEFVRRGSSEEAQAFPSRSWKKAIVEDFVLKRPPNLLKRRHSITVCESPKIKVDRSRWSSRRGRKKPFQISEPIPEHESENDITDDVVNMAHDSPDCSLNLHRANGTSHQCGKDDVINVSNDYPSSRFNLHRANATSRQSNFSSNIASHSPNFSGQSSSCSNFSTVVILNPSNVSEKLNTHEGSSSSHMGNCSNSFSHVNDNSACSPHEISPHFSKSVNASHLTRNLPYSPLKSQNIMHDLTRSLKQERNIETHESQNGLKPTNESDNCRKFTTHTSNVSQDFTQKSDNLSRSTQISDNLPSDNVSDKSRSGNFIKITEDNNAMGNLPHEKPSYEINKSCSHLNSTSNHKNHGKEFDVVYSHKDNEDNIVIKNLRKSSTSDFVYRNFAYDISEISVDNSVNDESYDDNGISHNFQNIDDHAFDDITHLINNETDKHSFTRRNDDTGGVRIDVNDYEIHDFSPDSEIEAYGSKREFGYRNLDVSTLKRSKEIEKIYNENHGESESLFENSNCDKSSIFVTNVENSYVGNNLSHLSETESDQMSLKYRNVETEITQNSHDAKFDSNGTTTYHMDSDFEHNLTNKHTRKKSLHRSNSIDLKVDDNNKIRFENKIKSSISDLAKEISRNNNNNNFARPEKLSDNESDSDFDTISITNESCISACSPDLHLDCSCIKTGPVFIYTCLNCRPFPTQWKNPMECLSLTLDEVMHIRTVLTKAELDAMLSTPALYALVSKEKLCFTCKDTRFTFFGEWGSKCRFCKRTVCNKCIRKMNIPTEHFGTIPVYTLTPERKVNEVEHDLITKHLSTGSKPPSPLLPRRASTPTQSPHHPLHRKLSHPHPQPPPPRPTLQRAHTITSRPSSFTLRKPDMNVCRDCRDLICEIIRVSRVALTISDQNDDQNLISSPENQTFDRKDESYNDRTNSQSFLQENHTHTDDSDSQRFDSVKQSFDRDDRNCSNQDNDDSNTQSFDRKTDAYNYDNSFGPDSFHHENVSGKDDSETRPRKLRFDMQHT